MAKTPPKVNPLDAQVNSAIAAQTQPYMLQLGQSNQQYGADIGQSNTAGKALQGELGGIQKSLQGDSANLLALAAQRSAGNDSQLAQNRAYLQSILGNFMGDQSHQGIGAATNAGDVQNAYLQGLNSLSRGAQMGSMRGASAMATNEHLGELQTARQAAAKQIMNQISAIRAQAPLLRRQFGQENEQMNLARQELGLKKQAMENDFTNATLDRTAARDALLADARQKQIDAKTKANLADKTTAGTVYNNLWKRIEIKDGQGHGTGQFTTVPPKHQFQDSMAALINNGLSPDAAVYYAAKWTNGEKGIWQKGPAGIAGAVNALRNYGVSESVVKRVVNNVYARLYGKKKVYESILKQAQQAQAADQAAQRAGEQTLSQMMNSWMQ
jgi:hypothetical protein